MKTFILGLVLAAAFASPVWPAGEEDHDCLENQRWDAGAGRCIADTRTGTIGIAGETSVDAGVSSNASDRNSGTAFGASSSTSTTSRRTGVSGSAATGGGAGR